MKTIITHFYNEEYLLPWWLEHHKQIFDFGILIDYGSTDRSVEICKQICPHWQIFPSGFGEFDAANCDFEVMFYEKQIQGWRAAITVSEFIVGNIDKLTIDTTERVQWLMPCVIFADYHPVRELDPKLKLWEQNKMAIPYTLSDSAKLCRSLHNFNDFHYSTGRHCMPYNTEEALIFKFSNCIVGKGMINRRLQIKDKISLRDKVSGCSDHHLYVSGGGLREDTLLQYYRERLEPLGIVDCSDIIKRITS